MSEDPLSREHHVRRRAEQVRADLAALWGGDMPPGPDPQITTLVDRLALDDDHGRRHGLVVQGDAVPFHVVVRLLVSSPVGRQVLAQLPARLRARVDLAVTTLGEPAVDVRPADHGLPQTPSGAFALRVRPEVVDLDERTSGLLGLPARQHRLTWAQVLERVHPADRAQVQAATLASLHKQASLHQRFRVVHDDGGVHWLSTVAHALTGEDGGTEQIVGFAMPSP